MKKTKQFSLFVLLGLAQCMFSMEPPQEFCTATIENYLETSIRLTFYPPDPESCDGHGIIRDTKVLAHGESTQIMIISAYICPPRCAYQFPNDDGQYNELRCDTIEIPIDTTKRDVQKIRLAPRATKSAYKQ